MYTREPSMTSIRSSSVASSWSFTSAFTIPYSFKMFVTVSSSKNVVSPLLFGVNATPPRSFFLNVIFGGDLFKRMPIPNSSCSMSFLCVSGLSASRVMTMSEHVRAVEMTCRPRPLPSFAPSMIPGKSNSWIFAPRYRITPGMHVSVVNSYAATSENVPVSLFRSVDLPTDGKPTRPTRQSPVLVTSKPSPLGPDLPLGSIRSRRSFASFALSDPRCAAVALFFCVRLISSSIEAIFSMMSDMAKPSLGVHETECSLHWGVFLSRRVRERPPSASRR
mmetsp:Transcript_5695/g.23046  ORF Transcript_5695/g.23046 Transcript_5695/m.23046 type:complete len:277 (-) Transcript_5695:156-986(-)